MAATANVNVHSVINGAPGGSIITDYSITSAAANWQIQNLVLASGANTITVPALPATNGCHIILDPLSTIVVTLKGVTGDTGVAIGKTTKQTLNWDPAAPPASFVLTSASIQTGFNTQIIFF